MIFPILHDGTRMDILVAESILAAAAAAAAATEVVRAVLRTLRRAGNPVNEMDSVLLLFAFLLRLALLLLLTFLILNRFLLHNLRVLAQLFLDVLHEFRRLDSTFNSHRPSSHVRFHR